MKMNTIYARDFGIVPEESCSCTQAMALLLQNVPGGSEIIFDHGIYHLGALCADGGQSTWSGSASFLLKDLHQVVLDFKGSELVLDGWQTPIVLDQCENITLKNGLIRSKAVAGREKKEVDAGEDGNGVEALIICQSSRECSFEGMQIVNPYKNGFAFFSCHTVSIRRTTMIFEEENSCCGDALLFENCRGLLHINDCTFDGRFSGAIRVGNGFVKNRGNKPEVIIENCRFTSLLAQGIFVTAPRNVVIRGNQFKTSGVAILVDGEGFECDVFQSVCIINNRFVDCCPARLPSTNADQGMIRLGAVTEETESNWAHENIMICHNRFENPGRRILNATSWRRVSVFGNALLFDEEPCGKWQDYVCFEHYTTVKAENNRILNKSTMHKIRIAFLGDSITEGCFELVERADGSIHIVRDVATAYAYLLKSKLDQTDERLLTEIINAGVSGNTSANALERMDHDVLSQKPDIVVVCLGLNDVCTRRTDNYAKNLADIFSKLTAASVPVIYMTPNMVNTYVHEKTVAYFLRAAKDCCRCQNEGVMDALVQVGRETAARYGCELCDCYAYWKELQERGVDTTALLCNYINHPSRKMHGLFADKLFEIIWKRLEERGTVK